MLMGATGPRIEKAVREDPNFNEAELPIQHADNMQHAVEPVSYTHLDVYKRQGQDHRGAVHVVGTQPAHGALAQTVVGHHAEEGLSLIHI